METNLLLTGPPGCGKTTVLMRLTELLRNRGYLVGGVICPEMRAGRSRAGFQIVDLLGRSGVLSHVSLARKGGPMVSRYGVNLKDLEDISMEAFQRDADVYVVDEIGPMELKSEIFAEGVEHVLGLPVPVVASIHHSVRHEFADRVRRRGDTKTIIVGPRNRDTLPLDILRWVLRFPHPGG